MLRDVLNNLQLQNSDIVHSLSDQLTYVKKLSTTVKLDTDSIANLSSIIRDEHDSSARTVPADGKTYYDLMSTFWTKYVTRNDQTARITLLQLIQQVSDLPDAIQLAIQGTLSIKLINPTILQGILRNVTLQLPEGYE
jgi:hypothetical protein